MFDLGLGQMVQSIGSWFTNQANIQEQRAVNKQNREWSLQDDLRNWNRIREYYSPSAQMDRFRQAGLNPNLIYKEMYNPPVSTHGFQSGAAARSENPLSGLTQTALMKSQVDNLAAQNELTRATIDSVRAKTAKTLFETGWIQKHGMYKGLAGEWFPVLKDLVNWVSSKVHLSNPIPGAVSAVKKVVQPAAAEVVKQTKKYQGRTGEFYKWYNMM